MGPGFRVYSVGLGVQFFTELALNLADFSFIAFVFAAAASARLDAESSLRSPHGYMNEPPPARLQPVCFNTLPPPMNHRMIKITTRTDR